MARGKIISASRRTDIPAHFVPWLLERLRAGYVHVRQPWSGRIHRVSLLPEDVHAIVFWSKNVAPLLSHLDEVLRITPFLFFHVTLTGVPIEMEPGCPPEMEVVRDIRFLSRRFSPEQLVWRFDPIVFTDRFGFGAYEERFVRLASRLTGFVRRCVTSFVHPYPKVLSRFRTAGFEPVMPSLEERVRLVTRLRHLAERSGMRLEVCCNPELVSETAAGGARCVDGPLMEWIFGSPLADVRPAPTRKGCGCSQSQDIGGYGTCRSGCLYCYATGPGPLQEVNITGSGLGFDVPAEDP